MNEFAVSCLNCGEETILTSKYDGYFGFHSEDILSSNPNIHFTIKDKIGKLECKCGNKIIEY